MDLIQVHLKKDVERRKSIGWVDLTALSDDEARWLLETCVVAIPVLVRTLIAMHQNGIDPIVLSHRDDQSALKDALAANHLVGRHLQWVCGPAAASDWGRRFASDGGYWVSPRFLMNGLFLEAFEAEIQRSGRTARAVQNGCSGEHVVWLTPMAAGEVLGKNGQAMNFLQELMPNRVDLQDPEADGQVIGSRRDLRRAEKILCKDITRKKGGFIAKRFNEPISLWIARQCAKVPVITPNFMTLVNTILGVLSSWLVYYGAREVLYWPIACGAVLFYAVDIFDGIDGELARFTFRYSKNGALYDTVSDQITLMSFIVASFYAAYMHVQRAWVILAGVYTLTASIGAALYLFWFTMHYFGNGSLRLYEVRFLQKVPQDDLMVRFIGFLKHFYTKDVICALLALPLLLNLPIIIAIGAPLFISLMFVGFVYLGLRYAGTLPPRV